MGLYPRTSGQLIAPTSTSIARNTNEWKFAFILFHPLIAWTLRIKFHYFFVFSQTLCLKYGLGFSSFK